MPFARARTPSVSAQRKPRTPTATNRAQRRSKDLREQPKEARMEKPPPSSYIPSSPKRRASGGVKAFLAARYHDEQDANPQPNTSGPGLSLHEFLDSVPRSPQKVRRQPRDPCPVPPRASETLHDRDISVKEFLNLVPAPPGEQPATRPLDSPQPPESAARASPLVSRLPKGIEMPTRGDGQPQGRTSPAAHQQSRTPSTATIVRTRPLTSNIRDPIRDRHVRSPITSRDTSLAVNPAQNSAVASRNRESQPAKSPVAARLSEPPQAQLRGYSLDFDGFTDRESSYFPSKDWSTERDATSSQARGTRGSTRPSKSPSVRSRRPEPLGRVMLDQTNRVVNVTASDAPVPLTSVNPSPISLQHSPYYTGSQASLGLESISTYDPPMPSPRPQKNFAKSPVAASWSLPAIKQSGSESDSFSNMFEDSDRAGDQNILIFTSDEEDEEDEDDLPTPRMQKLEEDVHFPPTGWGMISAGKQVTPGFRDPDSMSDMSAVYPPDIGRNHTGGEDGSPLVVTLQSMRHGGELGAAYKPHSRSGFRKSINTAEILQRLGIRRTTASSESGSIRGSDISGKSNTKGRPMYHPASSSRGRLPLNE